MLLFAGIIALRICAHARIDNPLKTINGTKSKFRYGGLRDSRLAHAAIVSFVRPLQRRNRIHATFASCNAVDQIINSVIAANTSESESLYGVWRLEQSASRKRKPW